MYHAVLDLGKLLLNAVMYPVCNIVCFCQCGIPIGSNINLHIDPVAEQPGLEPVNALSGYRMGRVPCYEEVEDAATCFFFDSLGKGVYVLEHRQRVARSGLYEAGIATVQCAYAPEYASHSAGTTLQVGEGK